MVEDKNENGEEKSVAEKKQKIDQLVKSSEEPLMELQSTFPFTLFPDKIVIFKHKVDFIYPFFFFTKKIYSVLVANIAIVEISMGLFFATLIVQVEGPEQNPQKISFLSKQEAVRAKRLLLGLVTLKRQHEISVEDLKRSSQLLDRLIKIGKVQEESS